jgi:hypothetical protein
MHNYASRLKSETYEFFAAKNCLSKSFISFVTLSTAYFPKLLYSDHPPNAGCNPAQKAFLAYGSQAGITLL